MTDDELEQLVKSNARAIQALSDNVAELTNDIRDAQKASQSERLELRQAMIGLANRHLSGCPLNQASHDIKVKIVGPDR